MNTDAVLAFQLARTYGHRVSACRPTADGGEEPVCENARCALSRSAQVAAPAPAGAEASVPEAAYRMTLYTPPEVTFALGDRLEITDGTRVWHATASDSFSYPSHAVTVVEISEVLPAAEETS